MLGKEGSLRYEAETYVTVGCLGCPSRQVLEYKQGPGVEPATVLRAGLIAAAQCAVLNTELPERHMPPYTITQTVEAIVKIDGEYPFSGGGSGYITDMTSPSEACPPDCAEQVIEVADSVRTAIAENQ